MTVAAERGAAIARTNVTAAPAEAPRATGTRTGAPATTNAPATSVPTTSAPTTSAPATSAPTTSAPSVPTTSAPTTGAPSGTTTSAPPAAGAAESTAAIDAAARAATAADAAASVRDAREPAAAADVRVAEALGLRMPPAPQASVMPAAVARATTPLGRALAHAAWVDAQLRTVTAAPAETVRPTAGYVFIAPAEARPAAIEGERAPSPYAGRGADAAPMVRALEAARASDAIGATTTSAARVQRPVAASASPVAAWSARLPDPRLPETAPTAIAQRVAAFVARLAGVETARDVAALAPMVARSAETPAAAATASSIVRAAPAATYVALPAVSWRPGAAMARSEQLGARVDARVTAAWGERVPVPAAAATSAPEVVRAATAAEMAPAAAVRGETDARAGVAGNRNDLCGAGAVARDRTGADGGLRATARRRAGGAGDGGAAGAGDGGRRRGQGARQSVRRAGTAAAHGRCGYGGRSERGQPAHAGADRAGGDRCRRRQSRTPWASAAWRGGPSSSDGPGRRARGEPLQSTSWMPSRFALLARAWRRRCRQVAPEVTAPPPASDTIMPAPQPAVRRRPRRRGCAAERRGVVAGGHLPVGGDGGAAGGGARVASAGVTGAADDSVRRRLTASLARGPESPDARRSAGALRGAVG